nr:FAD-binding protein [Treponema sp.]
LLTEAQSLDELSKKLGIDSGRFEKTIKRWNSFVAEKNDKDFGRNKKSMDRALDKAPYYAIEVEPAIHHTMGGLKINSSAQVMNKSGTVIPGLYAAGEVTGGVHGANRLGGNAVADICIFGKIAADSALEQIGK